MKLNLYDKFLNRISIIEGRYVSAVWSEGYNTTQPFTLDVLATEEYKKKVKPDCYVGRDDRKTLMVIKTVWVKSGHIVATGKQASRCLDDVTCETIIQAGSNLANSIKAAYEASFKFENIEFRTQELDVVYEHQISNKSCLSLMETMCQETDTGFRVVRDGKKLIAEFYKPSVNPNRILSERYGSLKVDTITMSTENLKNYAVVLGEGEGEDRYRVYVDLSEGGQKRAIFVDARDLRREDEEDDSSYSARLYARGVEKLLEQKGTWECAMNPLPQEFGNLYDLGDVITVLLPDYDMKLQARIMRFTQQSQNNVTKTTLEIGRITIVR